MKIAVIGSRSLSIDKNVIGSFLPEGSITEIVSGDAKGIDASARAYAQANGIPMGSQEKSQ